MMHSLRARLWLSFALLVGGVLCIIAGGLVVYAARNPTPARLLTLRLDIYAIFLSQAERLPPAKNIDRLLAAAQRVDQALNVRLTVLSPDGNSIADTRPEQGSVPLPPAAYLSNPTRATLDYRDSSGKFWIYSARYLPDGNVLVVSSPRLRLTLAQFIQEEAFLAPLAQAGVFALIVALLLAIWLSGWITKPLRNLAASVRAMSNGKFSPLSIQGPSEVQEVSQAFNEMAQRVQASQQSQRDFIANVSHDLKTPLTSIQGFSQAILDGTASRPEDLQKAAQIIHSEAERMNRMVLDLLEIARLDAKIVEFERKPIDLAILVDQIAGQFTPQARQKDITMQTDLPMTAMVTGDRDRLAQVFSNLVDNALKYSPNGSAVRLNLLVKNNYVEVQVCDSGPGIPTDDLEKIFDRFYQVDKSRAVNTPQGNRRGVGLGLAIAREIVQAHGGVISVYNQTAPHGAGDSASQGSVFVVKLPVAPPAISMTGKIRK